MDKRMQELFELAEAEGLELPMAPEAIIRLEDQGHVVDLRTGAVEVGEGDRPYIWNWTPAGEAFAHLVSLGLALVVTVIWFTGLHDWNGNWAMDSGEQMAGGQFRIYVTAADGAVSMVEVALPMGNWYQLEVEAGDRVRVESGCGSVTIQTGDVWYVPVICGSVFAPMVGGAQWE